MDKQAEKEKVIMEKTFEFGYVAFAKPKSADAVTVTAKLVENENGDKIFKAEGYVHNRQKAMFTLADNFKSLQENKVFSAIYTMSEKYNDLHAGTKRQEDALKQAVAKGKIKNCNADNYNEICNYLQSINLLEDNEYLVSKMQKDGSVKEVPYKYGTDWLIHEIPESDLEIIENLLGTEKEYDEKSEEDYEKKEDDYEMEM